MALPNGELQITPLNPQHAYPVDKRMQADTLNSRDSISPYIRWRGMQVHVLETDTTYMLKGGVTNEFWTVLGEGSGGGGSTFVGQFETVDLLPATASPGDYAYVGDSENFLQYNWDNIAGKWVSNATNLSPEKFYTSMVANGPVLEKVVFTKTFKDEVVEEDGAQVIYPSEMRNFIFTGSGVVLEGVGYADEENEFSVENRTDGTLSIITNGGVANTEFAVSTTIPVGGKKAFKGNGTTWDEVEVNDIAFSDSINSSNAIFSTDRDGLEIISNVYDINTGALYNYKEYGSIPSIIDGNIFVQVGAKYFKRVFTTPVDLESVGIKYNDSSSAVNNASIMATLINLGQPICVKDKVFLSATTSYNITSPKLLIYGDNEYSELYFTNAGTPFNFIDNMESYVTSNVKITCENGYVRMFVKDSVDFTIDKFQINGCEINGEITYLMHGTGLTLNSKINNINVSNNIFMNTTKTFINMIDCAYDMFQLNNNKIYDFRFLFLQTSISSKDANFAYDLKASMKKLEVNGNYVLNGPDIFNDSASSTYFAFILTEAHESVYINNHVEGLKSVTEARIYDIYQSTETSTYINNTNKNNICFSPDAITKPLYTQKGSIECKVENNRFIIEKSFLEDFISDNPTYGLLLSDCWVSYFYADTVEDRPASTYYRNNIIDVYYLKNNNIREQPFYRFINDNNYFDCEIIETPGIFIPIVDAIDYGGKRLFSFSGNTINTSNLTGSIIRGNISANPSLIPSEINVKFNRNVIRGIKSPILDGVNMDNIEISDNEFYIENPGTSILQFNTIVRGEMIGENNKIYTSIPHAPYLYTSRINKLSISHEITYSNTKSDSNNRLPIMETDYDYTIGRKFEIKSQLYGNVDISILLHHEFDGVNSWLTYTDFDVNETYTVQYTEPIVFGNTSSSHILYTIESPVTGGTMGTIRIRQAGNIPYLTLELINNSDYKIKYTDNAY